MKYIFAREHNIKTFCQVEGLIFEFLFNSNDERSIARSFILKISQISRRISNEICDTLFDIFKIKILASVHSTNLPLKCAIEICYRMYILFYCTVVQLAVILLVTLAFPQNDQSRKVFDGSSSTTTPTTTINCPCIATSEYNPVCGSDNVTYWNMGRFNCAKNCNPRKAL